LNKNYVGHEECVSYVSATFIHNSFPSDKAVIGTVCSKRSLAQQILVKLYNIDFFETGLAVLKLLLHAYIHAQRDRVILIGILEVCLE
jgi:hypothetical protein